MNKSFRESKRLSEGQRLREELDETIERLGIHLTAKRTPPAPIIIPTASTLTPTLEPKPKRSRTSLRYWTTIYHNRESSMFLTCSSTAECLDNSLETLPPQAS